MEENNNKRGGMNTRILILMFLLLFDTRAFAVSYAIVCTNGVTNIVINDIESVALANEAVGKIINRGWSCEIVKTSY